jgi:hypothetical protein
VAALHRAVALEEVDHIAMAVGQDLDLHVAGVGEVALEVDGGVGEELLALARCALEGLLELVLGLRHPEPLAAAAARGLDGHRVADRVLDHLAGVVHRLHRIGGAGDDGHPRLLHELAGPGLRAHGVDGVGGRPDEDHARVLAGAGKGRVLRQEAVARVDRLGARLASHLENLVHHQVALRRRPGAEQVGLVGAADVEGVAVGLRVDGHGGDAHLLERPHYPDRDLTAIGDQNLGEHRRARLEGGQVSPGQGQRALRLGLPGPHRGGVGAGAVAVPLAATPRATENGPRCDGRR